jgi:hypothetical protein
MAGMLFVLLSGVLTTSLVVATAVPMFKQADRLEVVTFRADHTFLVNGRPFFPLGLYYCAEEFEDPSGKLLEEFKAYGFNTAGFYRYGTPSWREELDRAHRLGLKVWVRGHNGFALDTPTAEKAALDQVRNLREHPALLAWEFEDEPLYNKVSIAAARKGHELVKREDPHHPLLTVEWPGAVHRLAEWKGLGDVFAVDLYPIPRSRGYGRLPNKDITQMRDYLAALRTAHGEKPFLLVLQAWAWEPLKDGAKGYPTPHESRFMAYQAVIHGAKGLFYYGQLHCTRPNPAAALASASKDPQVQQTEFARCQELNRKFWIANRPLFRELNQATVIFLLEDAAASRTLTASPTVPALEGRTKQQGAHLYHLVVNASDQPQRVTYRLPPNVQAATIHVLFEGRTLPVVNGTFTDAFRPYDVHVYATTSDLPR